jgi:hypothetical protein
MKENQKLFHVIGLSAAFTVPIYRTFLATIPQNFGIFTKILTTTNKNKLMQVRFSNSTFQTLQQWM